MSELNSILEGSVSSVFSPCWQLKTNPLFLSLLSTLAYVGHDGSTIYVVFRGTTNLKNVLVDLAIFKKPVWSDLPDVKVHSGFRNAWLNLGPNVMLSIRTATLKCPTCKHVTFTGHSLGAAIATIAATEYARSGPSLAFDLFTLGSPRVGNSEFSAYATKMVTNNVRWTHTNDPIVHLPMKILGFQHRVREIWENGNNTNYKMCSTTNSEDPTCANSVIGVDFNMLRSHSTYGGLYLHSGTCDTFTRSIEGLSDEDRFALVRAANEDLARLV